VERIVYSVNVCLTVAEYHDTSWVYFEGVTAFGTTLEVPFEILDFRGPPRKMSETKVCRKVDFIL